MNRVEVDILGTKVLWVKAGEAAVVERNTLTWPEPRWLIGWAPWMGYGSTHCFESHYMLQHNGTSLFVRGPHRDSGATMYDEAKGSEFFPPDHGRYVAAGEPVSTEFLINPLGPIGSLVGGQANARIFSVKA